MGASHFLSSLSCELRILQAKNIEQKSSGNLFVRFYLSAGNNKRIQLNSQEITSKSSGLIVWDEPFSLECSGAGEFLSDLKQQTVVFELRWRGSKMPVVGKMGKSQVLGRAEMPWKAVLESPNMEIEKYWLTMVSVNHDRVLQSLDHSPSLQISMKVVLRGPSMVEIEKNKKKKKRLKNNLDGCGCNDNCGGYNSFADYDILALAAAMEAL